MDIGIIFCSHDNQYVVIDCNLSHQKVVDTKWLDFDICWLASRCSSWSAAVACHISSVSNHSIIGSDVVLYIESDLSLDRW